MIDPCFPKDRQLPEATQLPMSEEETRSMNRQMSKAADEMVRDSVQPMNGFDILAGHRRLSGRSK
jgi:hypothetical protein